jgi:hypothetical protein
MIKVKFSSNKILPEMIQSGYYIIGDLTGYLNVKDMTVNCEIKNHTIEEPFLFLSLIFL